MSAVARTPALVAEQVQVGYGRSPRSRKVVLSGVNATLRRGQLACLVGPNGAGKSTLLRSLARFQPLIGGDVTIEGQSITRMPARALAQRVAVVLTDRVVVGQLSAYDIVALGRYPYTDWSGRLGAADRRIVEQALDATGAAPLADRAVSQLSDGERQRVMLARALAQQPAVLLLDEPTAFLDVRGRLELTSLLLTLTHQRGLAVLMSTHDLEHMLRHADQVWLIDHDRRLVTGAPEVLGLDGSIQRAMAGAQGMRFDPYTGAFHTDRPLRGRARLLGDGIARIWTRRALERIGYAITDDEPADIQVTCPAPDGGAHWVLHHNGTEVPAGSLGDLIDRLHTTPEHAASPITATANPFP